MAEVLFLGKGQTPVSSILGTHIQLGDRCKHLDFVHCSSGCRPVYYTPGHCNSYHRLVGVLGILHDIGCTHHSNLGHS